MTFWEKAEKCNHENLTEHFVMVYCETPFCNGYEIHCKDCGVYISRCGCGYMNGIDGWSQRRRAKWLLQVDSNGIKK